MERITIYPDEELNKKILERAKRENRSLNNLILTILKREIKNEN